MYDRSTTYSLDGSCGSLYVQGRHIGKVNFWIIGGKCNLILICFLQLFVNFVLNLDLFGQY